MSNHVEDYIKAGGNPDLAKHTRGQDNARQAALREYQRQQALQDRAMTPAMKKANQRIKALLAWVTVLYIGVIYVLGVGLGSLFVFVAELVAVHAGIEAFDPERAWLYAFALTAFYIVLLLIAEINGAKHKHFTLATIKRSWRVFLGQEEPTPLSVGDLALKTSGVLMWVVVGLSVFGRMQTNLQQFIDTAWLQTFGEILYNSSLIELSSYMFAGLISYGLLRATHFIVPFMYRTFVTATGSAINFTNGDLSPMQSLEELENQYLNQYWQNQVLMLKQQNDNN